MSIILETVWFLIVTSILWKQVFVLPIYIGEHWGS